MNFGLAHLAAAWDAAFPAAPLAGQHVVLTVPASFDAGARELTREAALAASLPEDLVLLELWCRAAAGKGRWKMEFSVRDDAEPAGR